jgi:hypothetical protein
MSILKSHVASIKKLLEHKEFAAERYHRKGIVHYFWFANVIFISGGTCIAFNLDVGLSWIVTPLSVLVIFFFAKVMLAVNYIRLWPMILASWATNSPKESMDSNFTECEKK